MQTLSYGYKLPATGDPGSIFWSALEDNITLLNSHNHNGSNSSKLTVEAVSGVTDSIPAASWVATTGGTYKQLVTMPVGMLLDDYIPVFKNAAGDILHLSMEQNSNSSYYVFINDNTLTLTVLYK